MCIYDTIHRQTCFFPSQLLTLIHIGKEEGKDQETIQSSTTPEFMFLILLLLVVCFFATRPKRRTSQGYQSNTAQ